MARFLMCPDDLVPHNADRTTSRSFPRALAICLIAMLAMPPIAAQAQQIWFSSGDDLEVKGVVAHPDFMRLFDSPSPWPTGLGRVNVMQLRAPWFLRMPPETVQKAVEFLKQHNIALAVPFGFVNSENCGQGIEGLGSARQHNVYPREMKKRGVALDYAVMDEPLYYGHDYGGKNSCQSTMTGYLKWFIERRPR